MDEGSASDLDVGLSSLGSSGRFREHWPADWNTDHRAGSPRVGLPATGVSKLCHLVYGLHLPNGSHAITKPICNGPQLPIQFIILFRNGSQLDEFPSSGIARSVIQSLG